MTDIVERLRLLNELFIGAEPSQTAPLCNGTAQEMINLAQEAADEIERLRNALVPFAEAADTLDKEQWDDGSIEGSCAYITAKDCRDARDVLDAIEPHK